MLITINTVHDEAMSAFVVKIFEAVDKKTIGWVPYYHVQAIIIALVYLVQVPLHSAYASEPMARARAWQGGCLR